MHSIMNRSYFVGDDETTYQVGFTQFSSVFTTAKLASTCYRFGCCLLATYFQKGNKDRETVKHRQNFKCKNTTECGIEKCRLLPSTIAWEDLVDADPEVLLHLRGSVDCLRCSNFFMMSSTDHSVRHKAIPMSVM